jgi:60 kDa SS-A/Ro ribonucleoprotein
MDQLLKTKEKVDLIIYLSDNESWADRSYSYGSSGTGLRTLFEQYRNKVNKNAKLVLLDLTPSQTTQAAPDSNILLIAGFNDKVFSIIPEFMKSNDPDFWISTISKVQL